MTLLSDPSSAAARSPRAGAMWTASLAGIAIWIVHITAEAALVPYAEQHHDAVYLMHALTLVLALAAAACALWCLRLARAASSGEEEWSTGGRTAFIGWFGAITGCVSVVLIIVEGVYVATITIGRT